MWSRYTCGGEKIVWSEQNLAPEQDCKNKKKSQASGTSAAESAVKWTKLSEDFETHTILSWLWSQLLTRRSLSTANGKIKHLAEQFICLSLCPSLRVHGAIS